MKNFISITRKINTSKYLLIPEEIVKELNISEEDRILINIEKLDSSIKLYRCQLCLHYFTLTNDENLEPYCPSCDSENVAEIKEDLK